MDNSKDAVSNVNMRKKNATKRKRVIHKSKGSVTGSRLSDTSNHIPLGRQLFRTPPMSELKRHLSFNCETQTKELHLQPTEEKILQTIKESKTSAVTVPLNHGLNVTMELYAIQSLGSETCQRSCISSDPICTAAVLETEPCSVIRDEEDFKVTLEDMPSTNGAEQKGLQVDELLNQLRIKIKASREMFQADLDQILACEPGRALADGKIESKSVLAQKKTAKVQRAVQEEQAKIAELEDRVVNVLKLRKCEKIQEAAPSQVKTFKEPKRKYVKAPHVRIKAENRPSVVSTSDLETSLRRSSRVAKKTKGPL
ncbi:hypothetical protein DPEC_G00155260 [Dallia pectoralis]|uniref:Uncharacterized protein n=1 Tax=Dallia pectoralis TaxID=75939 RepID=A0ACC2GKB0_DALPE|nr:hypothetical protein DPEC_G00155260 [Dallia pectoralis]